MRIALLALCAVLLPLACRPSTHAEPQLPPGAADAPALPLSSSNPCEGARAVDAQTFAAASGVLVPGMAEADFRASVGAFFGDVDPAARVTFRDLCLGGGFERKAGRLTGYELDGRRGDEDAPGGLDETQFQSMRRDADALMRALTVCYGRPTRARAGPTHLPSAAALVNGPPPTPYCMVWSSGGVDRAVTLAVSIGKGQRDVTLRFEEKASRDAWAWTAC